MEEQETLDLSKATVLNVDLDYAKVTMMVKELALFVDGKDIGMIEAIFALNELAGRIVVSGCGGDPLVAAKIKQAVQKHLDNVVRVGYQATYRKTDAGIVTP